MALIMRVAFVDGWFDFTGSFGIAEVYPKIAGVRRKIAGVSLKTAEVWMKVADIQF